MVEDSYGLENEFKKLFWLAAGSVPGALIRVIIQNDIAVNLVGTIILGCLLGLPFRTRFKLFLGVGFCGALTTFSGWMLACVKLIFSGFWLKAICLLLLIWFFWCLGWSYRFLSWPQDYLFKADSIALVSSALLGSIALLKRLRTVPS